MICSRCQNDFPEHKFHIANRRKDGSIIRRTYCCKCYLLVKNKRKKQLKDWFISYKQSLSCHDCGFSFKDKHWLLDFHHINPNEKDSTISVLVTQGHYGKDIILKELSKCIPLCCNCHRTRHHFEKLGKEDSNLHDVLIPNEAA